MRHSGQKEKAESVSRVYESLLRAAEQHFQMLGIKVVDAAGAMVWAAIIPTEITGEAVASEVLDRKINDDGE